MSLLDDLEDEDVDSKPQPSGESFCDLYRGDRGLSGDRGKIYSE